MSELEEIFPTWFKKMQVTFSGMIPANKDERQQVLVIPYPVFKEAIEAYISKQILEEAKWWRANVVTALDGAAIKRADDRIEKLIKGGKS